MEMLDCSFNENEDITDVRTVMADDASAPSVLFSCNSMSSSPRVLSSAFDDCVKQVNYNVNSHMKVFLRIRPTSKNETSTVFVENETTISTSAPESSKRAQYTKLEERSYSFNRIFAEDSKQADIFDVIVAPMMERFLQGKNCVLLAYGMTNAGKTHTIQGTLQDPGIFPRLITSIINSQQSNQTSSTSLSSPSLNSGASSSNIDLKISMLEVYQEKIYDLLAAKKDFLTLREGSNKSVEVLKLSSHPVKSVQHVMQLLDTASQKRSKSNTLLNSVSSRSHAVYTLTLQLPNGEAPAVFHVVDLAGAERSTRTKSNFIQQKEANNINTSLMKLWRCLQGMQKRKGASADSSSGLEIIPYRESKITHLLMPDVAKSGLLGVAMITCINPQIEDYDETISVLSNASLAYKIKEISEFRPPNSSSYSNNPPAKTKADTNVKRKRDDKGSSSFSSHASLSRSEGFRDSDLHSNDENEEPIGGIFTNMPAPFTGDFCSLHGIKSLFSPSAFNKNKKQFPSSFGSQGDSNSQRSHSFDENSELKRMKSEMDSLLAENKFLIENRDMYIMNREFEIRAEICQQIEVTSKELLDKIQDLQQQIHEKNMESTNDVTKSCKKARKLIIAAANEDAARQLAETEEELERLRCQYDTDLELLKDENIKLEEEKLNYKSRVAELNAKLMRLKNNKSSLSPSRSPLTPLKSLVNDENTRSNIANAKLLTLSSYDATKLNKSLSPQFDRTISKGSGIINSENSSNIGNSQENSSHIGIDRSDYFLKMRSQFSLKV